jgi:hypothetical protein
MVLQTDFNLDLLLGIIIIQDGLTFFTLEVIKVGSGGNDNLITFSKSGVGMNLAAGLWVYYSLFNTVFYR